MRVFLDTHSLVFLYKREFKKSGRRSRRLLETEDLVYSPASRLELAFLRERGTLTLSESTLLDRLGAEFGLTEAQDRFRDVAAMAVALGWTRDVFDRQIVANAALHRDRLVTRNEAIHQNYRAAVW